MKLRRWVLIQAVITAASYLKNIQSSSTAPMAMPSV
jgi:hypothetical protein